MATNTVPETATRGTVVVDHLLVQRQSELAALFATLPPVTAAEIDGHWRGTLMAIRGVQLAPRSLGRLLYRLLALPGNLWRGKSFGGDRGANHWFSVRGPRFLRFAISEETSIVDGHPVLELNYDLAANPAPARRIRGEVRRIGSGALLARMNWKTRGGVTTLLYFTLTDPR